VDSILNFGELYTPMRIEVIVFDRVLAKEERGESKSYDSCSLTLVYSERKEAGGGAP
jgi:hypothetical protein